MTTVNSLRISWLQADSAKIMSADQKFFRGWQTGKIKIIKRKYTLVY
jgi:hypothetical protein